MRVRSALVLVALALGGCSGGSATPAPSGSATAAGQPWVVVKPGQATPSATASQYGGVAKPALPPVSFLPPAAGAACKIAWPEYQGQVFIPLQVTPGAGSLTVQWPNRYGSTYRVAAVKQSLVTGAQPEPVWKTVTPGSQCEGSATITGLTSGEAYIVWLDAPDTPRGVDGTRSLYSGRSGVVKPL
ncbi:hypothetical protein HH310_28250 [Actinoplanes sp. TBRC 11911]|uniref:hypothetical protein n=1 Tax=Actinoplanes sp. TBRC 11911 TaxID=2729386 RepID=UPI00145DB6B2|nr:hypothetical protein [Actinoplanes sp. TBRC 11911]NMO55065.1 hypothetical protein [Actinoplanes sp. TBRC 11911]